MSTPAIVAWIIATALAVLVYAVPAAPARRPPRHLQPAPPDPAARPEALAALIQQKIRARELAAAGQYATMLAEELLIETGPAAEDPGNPGHLLRLATDPHGAITLRGGPILLAVDPAAADRHPPGHIAIPVPPHLADPLAAAAWTYDVPPDTYAALARRT